MSRSAPSTRLSRADPTALFWRDPALPFVESRRACDSRACYRPHLHPTYSIGAVDSGHSLFSGVDVGPIALRPGTMVFVPAERVHACNPAPESAWSYKMLHLEADWLQALREEDAGALTRAAEPIRIVDAPATYTRFCQLNALLFSDAEAGAKEAALIAFIGDHDTEQGMRIESPCAPAHLAAQLRPALQRLRSAPAADIALQELAELAAMSRYRLIRAFRTVTGMTPHAWQLNARINLARARIRQDAPLARLAQELGFADQAHFQRVFKAHAGVSPGRFRRSRG